MTADKDVKPDFESEEHSSSCEDTSKDPQQDQDETSDTTDGTGESSGPDSSSSSSNTQDPPSVDDESNADDDPGANMGLLGHLGELRTRLVRSLIAAAVGMAACYGFAERIFTILMEPMKKVLEDHVASQMILPEDFFINLQVALEQGLKGTDFKYYEQLGVFMGALKKSLGPLAMSGHFQYTYPAEAFFAHIKVAIVAGIFLMSPVIFAQIWGFIAPGLYAHERRWVIPMALVSALFFVAGGTFGYFVVFPFGFEFFAGFASADIAFTPKLNEYLSFCLKLLFAFGVIFELPLFIFFLARLGIVTAQGLRKKRKYAILVSFIASAILTPPDPFTQCLMAGPLIILYELGVWVAFFFGKKKNKEMSEPPSSEEEAA